MPLKRKLIDVGNSRAVVIPAEWLKEKEERTGKPIEHILLEVNNVITIAVDEPGNQEKDADGEGIKENPAGAS